MELVFLGTGSMVPTKDRNVTGHVIDYKGECILVDCGEGTQRQMSIAGISRSKITKILITHWHGDHTGGNEAFGKDGVTIVAHESVKTVLASGSRNGRPLAHA